MFKTSLTERLRGPGCNTRRGGRERREEWGGRGTDVSSERTAVSTSTGEVQRPSSSLRYYATEVQTKDHKVFRSLSIKRECERK